ncbi:hypothetical protein GCM10020295_06550 [Streptomyces cinereospinus]
MATAVRPGGVVMRKVTGARRLGWSFTGKIILAPLGWAHTTVPSGVGPPAVHPDRVVALPLLGGVGGVVDVHRERAALADRPRGGDHEFVAVADGLRPFPVDGDLPQGVAREVEVEAGQGLGGGGVDGGAGGEGRPGRAPVEGERVTADGVAAVAVERQERVADARRAR